jgi:glucose-induced degradation protein 8
VLISSRDIHAMILDYLVLHGYNDTARKFASEANFRADVNDYDMHARVLIKRDILNGSLEAAVEKVNDLNPEVSSNFL